MNQCGHYGGIEAASIVLYSFLESSSDVKFASKLCGLKKQLLAPQQHYNLLFEGELQTDGNNVGRVDDRALVVDEETFRKIGAQLAAMGDKLSAEVGQSVVNNLAEQFRTQNVSSQVLSDAVNNILARMPRDMEQEKAMLLAAMFLAKKVANVVPSLLQQVFSTTVNYINQNLHDYVNNLGPQN
ncbi:BH3-interacting domain death agonist [Erythrolamprus reginae]|uniref:BH3-interacting domain death agonist n=1 Tax=Erythrolamprus reginae TaxID=121349 RepID=UPI00396D0151